MAEKQKPALRGWVCTKYKKEKTDRMCAHGTTVHRLVFTFRNDLIVFIVNIALRLYILILRTNGYRSFIRCQVEYCTTQIEVFEASQERYFVLPLSFVCVSLLSLLVNFHQNKVQGISSITKARKLTLFKESAVHYDKKPVTPSTPRRTLLRHSA